MTPASGLTHKRWWLWLPLLAAAAWLALFADDAPSKAAPAVSEPVRSVGTRPGATGAVAPSQSALIPREELIAAAGKDPARDLFAPRSWTPPPPLPQPVQEKPAAPPLPFTFVGKKLEGKDWEVYLARGDQTLIVKAGTLIDATYRVERAEPPALVLTYLPMGQQQTLAIGEPQ